ncbi:hypothetical protein DFH11DRAFT_462151 [Phellopilus nigrolimitatus]|nr:hypothetical protein DFH11DRAFT_462151 [Phellopilus nigrolimitatus]
MAMCWACERQVDGTLHRCSSCGSRKRSTRPLRTAAIHAIENEIETRSGRPNIMFVFVSYNEIHPGLKKLCDSKFGITTVCMQMVNIRKERLGWIPLEYPPQGQHETWKLPSCPLIFSKPQLRLSLSSPRADHYQSRALKLPASLPATSTMSSSVQQKIQYLRTLPAVRERCNKVHINSARAPCIS